MKSVGSWLLTFFVAMFWLFRIVVAVKGQFGDDWGGFKVFNTTVEIILLFLTILCFILIVKRKLLGRIILSCRLWILFWKISIIRRI